MVSMELFPGASDRERIKSCLADLAKTSSDFHSLAGKVVANERASFLSVLIVLFTLFYPLTARVCLPHLDPSFSPCEFLFQLAHHPSIGNV